MTIEFIENQLDIFYKNVKHKKVLKQDILDLVDKTINFKIALDALKKEDSEYALDVLNLIFTKNKEAYDSFFIYFHSQLCFLLKLRKSLIIEKKIKFPVAEWSEIPNRFAVEFNNNGLYLCHFMKFYKKTNRNDKENTEYLFILV